jgi:hypothetical protein
VIVSRGAAFSAASAAWLEMGLASVRSRAGGAQVEPRTPTRGHAVPAPSPIKGEGRQAEGTSRGRGNRTGRAFDGSPRVSFSRGRRLLDAYRLFFYVFAVAQKAAQRELGAQHERVPHVVVHKIGDVDG